MRTLPAGIEAHIDDRRYRAVHVFEITGGGYAPLRWTDAPFPVTYGGVTYTQFWFSVGDVVTDADDNEACELVFPDVDRVLRTLILGQQWSKRPCTLREVWLDTSGEPYDDGAYIVTDGRAEPVDVNLEDTTEPVTLAIVPDSENEGSESGQKWNGGTCRYVDKYKGLQCGYAGLLPTCSGTWVDCGDHNNRERFGGARLAPAAGETLEVGIGSTVVGSRAE